MVLLPLSLRCLGAPRLPLVLRPLPRVFPTSGAAASFTTSSTLLANPPKKANPQKGGNVKNLKAIAAKQRASSNKFQHKRKKRDIPERKRQYLDGQRKIIKNTIVLSNTNAPAITLPEMAKELAGNPETENTVFEIPGSVVDKLRHIEAFKTGQHWPYFQKPGTLVRKESTEIGAMINAVNEARLNKTELHERRILDGVKGSGRSILLAQAMAWAFQSDWVVISIPNSLDLVLGHTEYEYDTHWNVWVQKEYTAALLQRIHKANAPLLKNLKSTTPHRVGKTEKTFQTLLKLVDAGIEDSTVSHDIFMALIAELSMTDRPPVLFALDNLSLISRLSENRDTGFAKIHAHDLGIPNIFLSYLNGTKDFPRGLTIAATAPSPRTPDLTLALKGEKPGPWDKTDERIAPSIKGAKVVKCDPLRKEEVKTLMDWYTAGGIYKSAVTLETVAESYALSNGNPAELFKGCLRLKY
ncbi:uncharacterized protein LAJ45_07388 [Morchella importuna]|uniref:uncharacterized protein n=1 Tax=Morchella importuna TaxID=1174673 RepID=UPI001E8D8493|nr:uncharacterized protein LAJ45_07388 [Morchella importuna]KAH8148677.1 hypothetical protein LAJ45_07388 [Morchella importuna]